MLFSYFFCFGSRRWGGATLVMFEPSWAQGSEVGLECFSKKNRRKCMATVGKIVLGLIWRQS